MLARVLMVFDGFCMFLCAFGYVTGPTRTFDSSDLSKDRNLLDNFTLFGDPAAEIPSTRDSDPLKAVVDRTLAPDFL